MVTIPAGYNSNTFVLTVLGGIAAPNTRSTRTRGAPVQNTQPSPLGGLSGSISRALATICGIVTTGGTQMAAAMEHKPGGKQNADGRRHSLLYYYYRRSEFARSLQYGSRIDGKYQRGRPSPVGSSKVVDALMQLATGSDVALAVAAREILPKIVSAKDGPDGQSVVTYRSDPALEAFKPANLPEALSRHVDTGMERSHDLKYRFVHGKRSEAGPIRSEFPERQDVRLIHPYRNGNDKRQRRYEQKDPDLNCNFGGGSSSGQAFNWQVVLNPPGTGTQPLINFNRRPPCIQATRRSSTPRGKFCPVCVFHAVIASGAKQSRAKCTT